MDGGLVPVVVPGVAPDELAASLDRLQLVGSVIDGSVLGVDGAAVARLTGTDGQVVAVGPDGDSSWIDEDVVLGHLEAEWPDVVMGDEAADRHGLSWPVMQVRGARTIAVTPPADLMLALFARTAELTLHEARVDDRLLVGLADGQDTYVDVLVDVLVNAKGRSVVLWRDGRHTALHVLKRGKSVQAHLWEPAWTPFGHPLLDELRDPGVVGDASAIGSLLGLPTDDVVSLRAMLRRPEPDLAALAELLRLPAVVVDVLEGRTSVAALPGGSVPEPASWRQELARAAKPSEHDPAWVRWFDDGARELRPWYVVASLVGLVAGAALVVQWVADGSAFFGVVGLVLALAESIDLSVRWWRRRRRRA